MKAEVDIKPFLKVIHEFSTAEQQPCGVQVVEWVGLVPPVKELVKELFAPDKS